MKIIHCADVHLDSPMSRLSTDEKRKLRRAELVRAFENMIEFAVDNDVSAVIIAGDLFDVEKVSQDTRHIVWSSIKEHPGIGFYYLKGNHDKSDILCKGEETPANLFTFGDSWKTYSLGENIYISGIELNSVNADDVYRSLLLEKEHFNIVTLHGQESMSSAGDRTEVINLGKLQNKYIDYLALGHVHAFKCEKFDARGCYCYPGCLEARGFDETGSHGYMLLDIDGENGTVKVVRNEAPIRNAYKINIDIGGCMNSADVTKRIDEEIARLAVGQKHMVELVLTGELDYDADVNDTYIQRVYQDKFFDFKLKNLAAFKVDYETFRHDASLKGEFIRAVEADGGLSAEEKAKVIRIGIDALGGRF